MKKLLGIEITDEEFDNLMREQSQGKELKTIGGQIVAVEHKINQAEEKQLRVMQIQSRLAELSQDFIQVQCGAVFADLEQRKAEFRSLHNQLRMLNGKLPRTYQSLNEF